MLSCCVRNASVVLTSFICTVHRGLGPLGEEPAFYQLDHVGLGLVAADMTGLRSNGLGKTTLCISSFLWWDGIISIRFRLRHLPCATGVIALNCCA